MEKFTKFDDIDTLIKNRVNITIVRKDKESSFRIVGFDPYGLTGLPKGLILIERNTHEILNIKESDLRELQIFVGKYESEFIDDLMIANLEKEIFLIKSINQQKWTKV